MGFTLDKNRSEIWFARKIFIEKPIQFEELLLKFVKPSIEELEKEDAIKSFHFFRYIDQQGTYIRLRILTDEKNLLENVQPFIEQEVQEYKKKGLILEVGEDDYSPPINKWGKQEWAILQKHFEYMSKTSLRLLETKSNDKLKNNDQTNYSPVLPIVIDNELDHPLERHMHLLSNQLGFSLKEEALFHLIQFMNKWSDSQIKKIILSALRDQGIIKRKEKSDGER